MNPSTQVTSQGEPDPDSIKMFVGQIPRSMDENELRKMFEDYGPVHSLNILRDKNTGQSKGCCFVTFFTRKAALDAQNALHNVKTMPMMHHPVQMKPADSEKRNGERNVEERKLFVGMLSKKLSENDVRMLFESFGTIDDCTVLRDSNGTSKGCAFITFASRQCAMNSIKGMHHSQTMEGCSSPLVVKMADTQKEKEQKKMQQMSSNLWMQFSNMGAMGPQCLAQAASGGNMGGNTGGGFNNMGNMGTAMNALGNQNMPFNNGGNNNAGQGGAGMGMGNMGMGNMGNNMGGMGGMGSNMGGGMGNNMGGGMGGNMGGMGGNMGGNMGNNMGNNMGGLGGMGGLGNLGNMGNNSNMGGSGGFSNNAMNGFGNNSSGMDALSQAYSGIQQYAASFPNAFNPQAQMQQANSAGKHSEGPRVPGPDGANLFIYHLPQEFGDQDLMQMFMPFGNVVSAKVFIDKQTNLSKCFGFVSYDSPLAAQAAITSMNGFQIGMKRLKVQLKRSKNDKPY